MNASNTLQQREPSFLRTMLTLAIPVALQNLLTSCATLIDTAMVVGLGNAATSAMGVAARFSFLLNVLCFGFASGCAALLSQYWGVKDLRNIRRSAGLALSVSMGFGIIYMILLAACPELLMSIFSDDPEIIRLGAGYLRIFSLSVPFLIFSQVMCTALRSVECVNLPLISSAVSVCVNTFFNYCLIFGHFGFPALGLRGAAAGTVAGCVMQAVVILLAILLADTPYRGRITDFFAFSRGFIRRYFTTAAPVLLNEGLWAVGTNIYVMVLARQGLENHSGYTIYENIQQIFFVFFVGICSACSIMVGKKVGQGRHEDAYRDAKRFAILTPIMGVVLGGLLILVRNPVLSLFPIETEAARAVASGCMLFYGFWISFRMIPYTMICGIFRAGGDTRAGCILDLAGMYACGIPAVLITGLLIKPQNFVVLVAVMFIAEDFIKAILCVTHFRSKKWIKQITEPSKPADTEVSEQEKETVSQ